MIKSSGVPRPEVAGGEGGVKPFVRSFHKMSNVLSENLKFRVGR